MKALYLLACPLLTLALPSCSSIDGETVTTANFEEGVPGGEVVETSTITATVTGIDNSKREVTFVTPKGKKFSTQVGPDVVNFDQIRIGDQLRVSLSTEVTIRMAKPGEKLDESGSLVAEVPGAGSKPGVQTTETGQFVATVIEINQKRRKVTLLFSDGVKKKVKARKDIDLSQRKLGEKVVIQVTETTAIGLEKP